MTRVLLIEDEELIRENCKELLEHAGYECLVAENGTEGIELATKNKPDIIFCDIQLPGQNGYEVKQKLLENKETAGIPMVYLTGKTKRSDLRRAMDLGAADYITKPFKIAELYSAIERITNVQKAIKDSLSEQVSNALSDFIYVAKHECNTPLHAIINLAQLLGHHPPLENYTQLTESIQTSAKRLHKTLNNLIDLMRLRQYNSERPLSNDSVDILSILQSLIPVNEKKYGVHIELHDKTKSTIVENVLKEDILLIVSELLDNAAKFSFSARPISIKLETENKHTLAVSFSNWIRPGQDHFYAQDIKPFRQFNRQTDENQGSGLGLHLATIISNQYNLDLKISYPQPEVLSVKITFPL